MSTSHSLHCDGKDNNHKGVTSEYPRDRNNILIALPSPRMTFFTVAERMAYEVFLGGSCNPTTWRSEIAIPTLQRLGITYYNPVNYLKFMISFELSSLSKK